MTNMVQVIWKEYWSKADAFLLPLTGLQKHEQYELSSYLFWEGHSIEEYKLILTVAYDDKTTFQKWCEERLFKVLDKRGYLLETYDYPCRTVFVLDMSEWAMDIEMFLAGKYSQLTRKTKQIIENYHTYDGNNIPIHIYAALHPNMQMAKLTDGKVVLTPIEYVAKFYEFNLEEMKRIGEIAGVVEPGYETLYVDVDSICQSDMKTGEV